MKILLFGQKGQLGACLEPLLSPLGELVTLDRSRCDLRSAAAVRDAVVQAAPDVIVNAAAYTAVDRAEAEPELAYAINRDAPAAMATAAAERGAFLVHYSTDYVFDGTKTSPYVESDAISPASVYGASKAAGEEAVRASGARALVLRTSWVFGPTGNNFVRTMLRLARERDSLRVVHDQVGNPTPAELLAAVTALALARHRPQRASVASVAAVASAETPPMPTGTYHVAGAESCSWNDFARVILESARAHPTLGIDFDIERVERIATSDYPTPARRPASSRLDSSRFERDFDLVLPSYRPYLERWLALRAG